MYKPTTSLWARSYPFLPLPLTIIQRFHELCPPDAPPHHTSVDFRVLVTIAAHGFHRDDWPTVALSWATLVKQTGLSKDTVRRSARRLAEADLLSIFPGDGPLSVNRYSLQPLINRLYLLHFDYALNHQLVPAAPMQLTMFAEDPADSATPELRNDVLSRRDRARLEAWRKAERKAPLVYHNGQAADNDAAEIQEAI